MRDLQRLEELSSTAALGLWADDLVLALGRAMSGSFTDADRDLLAQAATMIEGALEPSEPGTPAPASARDLAATNTALSALATIATQQVGDTGDVLSTIAKTIRAAADGALGPSDAERLQPVLKLFELISERQLVESNSVLTSRNDMDAWMAMQKTLSFS